VSLPDLIGEALKNNPEIVAAQKKYEAARQRPKQESTLPDPMVSIGYNSVGNPLPGAGIGKEPLANAGVLVSQELPYRGKLKLKGDLATKEAQAEFDQYEAIQLNVVSRLKQAYYKIQYTYAAADLLTKNRTLLERLLSVTEARYSAGKAQQPDVFKAQTQISIIETRLVKLEQERATREAEIDSLLSRPAGTPLGRPADIKPKPLKVTIVELFASAKENSPMLARDQKMIQKSELAVNMAKKEYYPDVTLNAGYYYMGSMPPMFEIRADVKTPLYFWRKQRPGVAERVNNLAQAQKTYEATGLSLQFRIKEDYTMAQASQRLMDLYTRNVVPQANLALESSLSTYETGAVDFLSVLSNFTMVLDYEMGYYDEALNFALALSRLEEMTGLELID
jgi:outer membrane protein TolC